MTISREEEYKLLQSLLEAFREVTLNEIKAVADVADGNNIEGRVPEKRPVQMGGQGFHGKVYGAGADKRHKNNVKGDDNRVKNYKDQVKKDKAADRGISDESRKERARANKDKAAYNKLDDLLKDVRKS